MRTDTQQGESIRKSYNLLKNVIFIYLFFYLLKIVIFIFLLFFLRVYFHVLSV